MTGELVENILNIPSAFRLDARFAFYVASCGFLLNMILGFLCLFEAVATLGHCNKDQYLDWYGLNVCNSLCAMAGYGIREVVIINFISSLVSVTAYILVAKQLLPSLCYA